MALHASVVHMPDSAPEHISFVANTVAIRWPDGREQYVSMEELRAASPSAENMGEPDLFGNIHGGDPRRHFPGVTVTGYEEIGRYAIRFIFSDGHQSGLYSFAYLKGLGEIV
jgi:DUF971 family protein